MKKKFKSKMFRVATEGATTDGRKIERKWIEQIAKNFDPEKYGARVWLEHFRGVMPDGPFRAYGDVVAVESKTVEDGKLALFAQIDPTDDLIAMNKQRQKLYTSLEINESFADTGEAYLVGMGVTDSPASLGTEALKFSANSGMLAGRKQDAKNLFTEAVEADLVFDEESEPEDKVSLADRVKSLFSSLRKKDNEERTEDFSAALEPVVSSIVQMENSFKKMQKDFAGMVSAKDFDALKKEFSDFRKAVEGADHDPVTRPAATGGNGAQLTEC